MRKITLIACLIFLFVSITNAQQGWWTWMHGDATPNSLGHFGAKGVSSPNNVPPDIFYPSANWTDSKGNFWTFGGGNTISNALWKYEIISNTWTWMHGDTTLNQGGVWGTKGVPSPNNKPSARGFGIVSWVDAQDNLWMFGGFGKDITNSSTIPYKGSLSDLWKYDPVTNMWTWVNGPNTYNAVGNYGVKGFAAVLNQPPGRSQTNASWVDSTGNFWMFGGHSNSNLGELNDLWKYEPITNMWTWMKGANTYGNIGNYGIKGVEASTNEPSARWVYAKWTDNAGKFWIFGGTHSSNTKSMNDLWRFDPVTNNWTWMSGANSFDNLPAFPNSCVASNSVYPQARFRNPTTWKDKCGNLWMFSGIWTGTGNNKNDIWCYKVQTNEWVFADGNRSKSYGTKGVANASNFPPPTQAGAAFQYNNEFWMFGGRDTTSGGNDLNTLWKYIPDSTCVQSFCNSLPTSILSKNSIHLKIYPNPNNGYFIIEGLNNGMQIKIYDILGREIYIAVASSKILQINLSEKKSGIYFYKIENENKQFSFGKIIIE